MVNKGLSLKVHPMAGHPMGHWEKSAAGAAGTHSLDKEQNAGIGQLEVCTRVVQSQGVPPGPAVLSTLRVRTRVAMAPQSVGLSKQVSGHTLHSDQALYWHATTAQVLSSKSHVEVSISTAF